MNIKCLKTRIGEDLIGDITENLDGSITIKKPMLVMINPNGQGGFGIGLFPYVPYADSREFTYAKDQYFFAFSAVQDLVNEYIRATSNLVIPSTPAPTDLKIVH